MIGKVKQLREETGAALGEIQSALASSGGDMEQARAILSEKLGAIAAKKAAKLVAVVVLPVPPF